MHTIHTSAESKSEQYAQLLPQIRALVAADADLFTAALANVCAVLKEQFGWLWVGFYLADNERGELQLAPFQGPVACTRIAKGRGVCGQVWAQNRTIIVDDVRLHPDHIACSSLSQSEIVVPLYSKRGGIIGVLDADDIRTGAFDEEDAHGLRQICNALTELLHAA